MITDEDLLKLEGDVLIVAFDTKEAKERMAHIRFVLRQEHSLMGIRDEASILKFDHLEITWVRKGMRLNIVAVSMMSESFIPSPTLRRTFDLVELCPRALGFQAFFRSLKERNRYG